MGGGGIAHMANFTSSRSDLRQGLLPVANVECGSGTFSIEGGAIISITAAVLGFPRPLIGHD
jgi:hypothetical protein